MNQPSVSIIVPVFNVEPYVEDCIWSVMRQTYDGPMECIIVDDCGTDNSMAVVEKVIAEYNGPISFIILHHEHNRGLSAARNTGMDAATGDYLFFLDSDDEISKECLLLMMNQVFEHPNIELVQGLIVSVPDKAYYHMERYQDIGYKEENMWIRHEFYKWRNSFPCQAWNKLIKTDFIRNNNLIFLDGIIHEDEHWMFLVVQKLNYYSVINTKTYIHYLRANSIIRTLPNNPQSSIKSVSQILLNLLPRIDRRYRYGQIVRLLSLFIRKYVGQGGKDSLWKFEKKFSFLLFQEHRYLGCMLLFLTLHFSWIKGGQHFKRRLIKYLEEVSNNNHKTE